MGWYYYTEDPLCLNPSSFYKGGLLSSTQVQKVTQEKDKYKELYEQSEMERKRLEKKSEEERRRFEKRIDLLSNKFNTLSKDLSEERELNKCLQVRFLCGIQFLNLDVVLGMSSHLMLDHNR